MQSTDKKFTKTLMSIDYPSLSEQYSPTKTA